MGRIKGSDSKIDNTGQKSHADADKQILKEIITPAIKNVLNGLPVGGLYMPEFGWFERTGKNELTMVMLIESRHFKSEEFVDKLKQIVESMEWTFKYADPMRYSGSVE